MTIKQKEREIAQYMKKLDISRAEAEQLWLDDQEDFIGAEGEEMTQKAKKIKNYTQGEKSKRKRAPRERKVDNDKKYLLALVATLYEGLDTIEITGRKTETEISFSYGSENYTLKLTKHRPPKK